MISTMWARSVRTLCLVGMLAAVALPAIAQQAGSVTGRVTEATSGAPIAGA